jgi:peptidyl-prolyl cis-trans isomerase C
VLARRAALEDRTALAWKGATLAVLTVACVACSRAPGSAPADALVSPKPTPDPDRDLPRVLPEIAARVNGQPIPIAGVHKLAKQGTSSHGKIPRAYREALQQLIDRELLFEEALDRHLTADDAAVQKAYDEARVKHPDDAEWASYLKLDFLTPEQFRTELRARFTIDALLRQEADKLPPLSESEAEARKLYDANPSAFDTGERIQMHQIFFAVREGAKVAERDAARAHAEEVLARIRKGGDFEALARAVSQDTTSSAQGGKLPAFAKGQADLPVELAAFALKPGQVSDVILTNAGYHILRVDGRLPSLHLPFSDVKQKLEANLRNELRKQRLAEFVAALRAKARIETYL